MRRYLVAAAFGLAASAAQAGLAVAPVRLQIDPGTLSTSFTATDNGADDKLLQVSIRRWTREAGEDRYADDDTLIVTPPLFRLGANGGRQVVRVGFVLPPSASPIEQAWRVFVDEVPNDARPPPPGQVRLQLRLGMPLFVPPALIRRTVEWRLERGSSGLQLVVENRGNVHARFDHIELRAAGVRQPVVALSGPAYVFPGEARRWPLGAARVTHGALRLRTQGGDGMAERDLTLPTS